MILLDENLSPKLAHRLADILLLLSAHNVGLRQAPDIAVWNYACGNGCTAIITADRDFAHLAAALGSPPKVILLERHNYRTAEVEALIRENLPRIHSFLKQLVMPLLILKR